MSQAQNGASLGVGMAHDHDHMAEMLDLDAVVLHDYHRDVITWAGSLVSEHPHIVDLGAGSGTGTLSLARHLTDAELIAVDMDARTCSPTCVIEPPRPASATGSVRCKPT